MCEYTISATFKGPQYTKYKLDANSAPEALYKVAKEMKRDARYNDIVRLEIIDVKSK